MKAKTYDLPLASRCLNTLLICLGLWIAREAVASGSWVRLTNTLPQNLNEMVLLSDGTVIVQQYGGSNWFRLTPDSYGNYVRGTWTTNAPMRYTRNFFSTALLRDGRLFVAGGEYGTGINTAEIYTPWNNSWTLASSPGANIVDAISKILPDGRVLVSPPNSFSPLIYDPVANQWTPGGSPGASQSEASWVKLPDGSILTVDPDTRNSERYIPSLNQWIADARVATNLYVALPGYVGEIGPGILLPTGKALFLGGTGHTALYTPSGTTNVGTWVAGPEIPGGLVSADSPAAMMVNGKVLCIVAAAPFVNGLGNVIFNPPISLCEYDPTNNSFALINGPPGATNVQNFVTTLLDLPDGSVLLCNSSGQLWDYQPDGAPLAAGTPVISSFSWGPGASLHLVGTLFNGLSEGAAYGDDAQMDSNYPLSRFGDGAGSVFYGRTFNWSDTGVATGNKIVSTDVMPPWNSLLTAGPYSFTVVANGISSFPVILNAPTWVDYNAGGFIHNGSFIFPYSTLAQGRDNVPTGGTIVIKSSHSAEALTINKAMTIVSYGGDATIGQ